MAIGRPMRTLETKPQRTGVPMSNLSLTAQDVRMIGEERRQLTLARQALAKIVGMFMWNEELGHWTVDPAWQGWIDEMMALRQQQTQTD